MDVFKIPPSGPVLLLFSILYCIKLRHQDFRHHIVGRTHAEHLLLKRVGVGFFYYHYCIDY